MIQSDGTVVFAGPKVTITPRTTRGDFLTSPLFDISKPLNQNVPWSRYSFQPVAGAGEQFAADICFCSGAIYDMMLCSIRSEFGSVMSTVNEQAKHCFHKQLLQSIFKRPPDERIQRGEDERDANARYIFPWGAVSAATAMKASGCFIFIEFAA
jgi:hypothetical protein